MAGFHGQRGMGLQQQSLGQVGRQVPRRRAPFSQSNLRNPGLLLLTSNGAPLLQEGDEFGRTKSGLGQDAARNSYDLESASGDTAVHAVNWIDWSLKDGSNSASGYGREPSDARADRATKRWTHFRKPDFADYTQNPRSQPSDPANDGRVTYLWERTCHRRPEPTRSDLVGPTGRARPYADLQRKLDAFHRDKPGRLVAAALEGARSWAPRGEDLCTLSDWTARPNVGQSFAIEGRSMAILAASR